MGKVVDPTTDKSLARAPEPKHKILFAQTDQQLWAKVKVLCSSVLPHFIYVSFSYVTLYLYVFLESWHNPNQAI